MLLRERGIELAILSGTFCAPIVPFPPHSLLGLPPVCLIQVAASATTAPRRLLKWHFYKRANLRLKSEEKINVTNVLLPAKKEALPRRRSDKAGQEERNGD